MRALCSLEIRARSKFVAGQIEAKGMARRIVSGVARDVGLVVGQLNIFEPDFLSVEIQSPN